VAPGALKQFHAKQLVWLYVARPLIPPVICEIQHDL
jgi:hypothetical protein